MSVSVVRQAGEPVILVTFAEGMTNHEIIKTYLDSVQMACDGPGTQPIYRVMDVRQAQNRATPIVAMIGEMNKGLAGAVVHPAIKMVVVGQPSLVNLTSMSLFQSLEAALSHIGSQSLASAA